MPRLIDHEERRNHIVDVTWDLIVEGGIEAATMREIAAKAGFANGALKHYFASKDMIVESTFQRALKMIHDSTVEGPELTGLEALRQFCLVTLPLDEERVKAGRVLLLYWSMALSNQHLLSEYGVFMRSCRELLASYLAQARAAGEIKTQTPDEQLVDEIVTFTAGAQVMGLVSRQYSTSEMLLAHLNTFLDRIRNA